MLRSLHETHQGSDRTTSTALLVVKKFMKWYNYTKVAREQRRTQDDIRSPWKGVEAPWERIHVDFCGPVEGRTQSDGGWCSHQMAESNTHGYYYHHWIGDQCIEDYFWKAGNFRSYSYRQWKAICGKKLRIFCVEHGIRNLMAAPYMPQSNEQAERFVNTLKLDVLKTNDEDGITTGKIRNFLEYPRKPNNWTSQHKVTPSEANSHCFGSDTSHSSSRVGQNEEEND